ncbi:MAG: kynureninase [Bacteroidetes bacterium CHB5]|nr:kynureninase [Bacteroidetes bacterium CHB5]
MQFENTLAFARNLDRTDPLKKFRALFHLPKVKGKTALYFTGNSLGLQPKSTRQFLTEELTAWAQLGVEGHLHSKRPWLYYHKFTKKGLALVAGAKPSEVVAMNHLTVNLHLLMVSFYRPTQTRYKILTEAGAFSSDQYAFESQVRFHNLNPDKTLVELKPRDGEHALRTEDILSAIHQHKDELALVIFGGVQYYTGQFFDIKKITQAGHAAGAVVGFDLAHAIGNVKLNLHKDQVDFAVWCSYKYLNAGPGAVAGVFVHERHAKRFDLPRFAGWWGHHEQERFQMKKGFIPMAGADGWQLSNHPVLPAAALLASLEIFRQAGIKHLQTKSILLTGYLEYLLNQTGCMGEKFLILTPSDKRARGCQLSIYMKQQGKKVFDVLTKAGVIADWREPNVIRVAPVPLYNTFEDVYRFAKIFNEALR